jgi:Family of unknown function (DUF5670)
MDRQRKLEKRVGSICVDSERAVPCASTRGRLWKVPSRTLDEIAAIRIGSRHLEKRVISALLLIKKERHRTAQALAQQGLEAVRPVLCFGQEDSMLFTLAVILLVLWLLGLVSGYTLGNFIYILLVIALVLFVVGLVSGRRTV